jgi:hypothetical protein
MTTNPQSIVNDNILSTVMKRSASYVTVSTGLMDGATECVFRPTFVDCVKECQRVYKLTYVTVSTEPHGLTECVFRAADCAKQCERRERAMAFVSSKASLHP